MVQQRLFPILFFLRGPRLFSPVLPSLSTHVVTPFSPRPIPSNSTFEGPCTILNPFFVELFCLQSCLTTVSGTLVNTCLSPVFSGDASLPLPTPNRSYFCRCFYREGFLGPGVFVPPIRSLEFFFQFPPFEFLLFTFLFEQNSKRSRRRSTLLLVTLT